MTHALPLVPLADDLCEVALAYATADNFVGVRIYARAEACLLEPAAVALTRAADIAAGIGCRLRVYDAFRPGWAQWRLWQHLPDPRYVADPRVGSNHSRGVAVDLTLVDMSSGQPLDMGTPFDDMTAASGHFEASLPVSVQRHRMLLLGVMHAAGFVHLPSEWWHYELPMAAQYQLIADDDPAAVRAMGTTTDAAGSRPDDAAR